MSRWFDGPNLGSQLSTGGNRRRAFVPRCSARLAVANVAGDEVAAGNKQRDALDPPTEIERRAERPGGLMRNYDLSGEGARWETA